MELKSFSQIVNFIIKIYGVSFDELVSKDRRAHIVKSRAALCYLLRNQLNWSYTQIGEKVNKDHSSVIHLVGKFNKDELVDKSKELKEYLEEKINNPYYQHRINKGGFWSRLFFERGGKCEIPDCGFDDVVEVHHLVSRKIGGTDDFWNLIILCPNHHKMIHSGLIKFKKDSFPFLKVPDELSTSYQKD